VSRPPLSVVIPTFRRHDSVARLLDALARQDRAGIEVILVDQNPPGFLEERIAPALAGVVHVRLETPNASTARNLGFSRSRGERVLFIDDDLVPTADFCGRALDRLARHPDVGCLCPLVIDADKTEAQALDEMRPHRLGAHPADPELWEIRATISAALFFERECFRRTGGFDEVLFGFARTGEDQELCLRMRARGLRLWLDPRLLVDHDHRVPGGCGLRDDDYWTARRRCIRSWALRARGHASRPGHLGPRELLGVSRSAFLNRGLVTLPFAETARNARALVEAVRESRAAFAGYPAHPGVLAVDHLARHL
jgi:GT2 family glycosyltransferase